jgi:antitoxin YefM
MLNGIKQKAVVGKNGRVELPTTELQEGTIVEVIILVEQVKPVKQIVCEDETTYLLSSEANKNRLLNAIENVEKGNITYVDVDEYEKNIF